MYSVQSAPNSEPAPPSSCRFATPKRCSFISTRSQRKLLPARTPFSSSIKPDGMAPKTSRRQALLPLPPRSPELNPQENIWQFMRANWLSNRVFKSFDDIVDHCCYAWNTLIDQPWKIMSVAHRDWAAVGHLI
jgi:transposase